MKVLLKKKRQNVINYDFIRVVESRISKINIREEEQLYNYEFECVCWDQDGEKRLHFFCERDFMEIRTHYSVIKE